METAKGVTNMALAHEILVNQAFQVKPAEVPEGRFVVLFGAVAWFGVVVFVFTCCGGQWFSCASPTSLEHRVKEIMHKAFWDYMEDQLKGDPPTYTHAIKLLAEIKEVKLLITAVNSLFFVV